MKHAALVLTLIAVLSTPALTRAYIASPQNGAFELKFGPYEPEIGVGDASGDNESAYKAAFGGGSMFLTELEIDWQFWHPPGVSFGVGGSIGFMQNWKTATTEEGGKSKDYLVLNVLPMAVLAVIRVDVLSEHMGIPLVPYIKGGLSYHLWWSLNAGDTDDHGGTLGMQLRPGIMFQLDPLDETSARTFDNEVGVNDSYLFFELIIADADHFGKDGHLDFTPKNIGNRATFVAGLALEF